jgi:hypothetical protein
VTAFTHEGEGAPEKGSALKLVMERLLAKGAVPKEGSETEWHCPLTDNHTHGDQNASLTVRYGDINPNMVVMSCAQCGDAKVFLPFLDLAMKDLYDRPTKVDRGKVVKTDRYVYADETGEPLFRVVKKRYERGKPDVFQQRWDAEEQRFRGGEGVMRGCRKPLYRLDRLLEAVGEGWELHLTEGESDADALNAWFIKNKVDAFATCHPEGAGKWQPEHTQALAGAAQGVVWADRDRPGYACAHERLSAALAAGVRAEARQPVEGKDVRDHLAAGHAPHDGKRIKKKALAQLAGEAKERADGAADDELEAEVAKAERQIMVREEARRRVLARRAEEGFRPLRRLSLKEALDGDRPEEPPTVIFGLHRQGYNTTITARYKTGKTTLGANLLRSLADGDPFLDRFSVAPPAGRIGLLNYETTENDMLEWLESSGIQNTDRIAIENLRGHPFSLASERNRQELIDWCREMDVEVLLMDPHRMAFAGFGKEIDNDDVNRFTATLDEVKAEAGVSDLFLFVHTGRGEADEGAEHARGATALDDWADQRWVLAKSKEPDDETRYFYADGRLPYVREFKLDFDPATRRLSAEEGNRRGQASDKQLKEVLSILETAGADGANTSDLKRLCGISKRQETAFTALLGRATGAGHVFRMVGGRGKETRYWLPAHVPEGQS